MFRSLSQLTITFTFNSVCYIPLVYYIFNTKNIDYLPYAGRSTLSLNNVTIMFIFNTTNQNADTYTLQTDGNSTLGTYSVTNISQYYTCVNSSDNLIFGFVSTGSTFNYIQTDQAGDYYVVKSSQALSGNEFIIPVTQGPCQNVEARVTKSPGYISSPFVPFIEPGAYTVELSLEYSGIDIVMEDNISQEEYGQGEHTFIIEKREVGNQTQIVISKR